MGSTSCYYRLNGSYDFLPAIRDCSLNSVKKVVIFEGDQKSN